MIKKLMIVTVMMLSSLNATEVYATFSVLAQKEASLVLAKGGVVKSIKVDVGSKVKKNQLLLELDNDDVSTSLVLAQKQIKLAKINLEYAKKSYDRFVEIKDVVDQEKFDNYSAAYERAKINLENAKASLTYKKALYAKTQLKAPFSGVIANKYVELGDGVNTSKPVFTLITPNAQKLLLSIDEKYWKKVKVGQVFTYNVDGDSKNYSGKISKTYPSINASKRSFNVEVKAKNLKVGLFGHGKLKVN